MSEFPPFADLVSLAGSLRKTGKHGNLQKILDSAWRAESCLGDLKQAADCCSVLRDSLTTKAEDMSGAQQTIDRALMSTAMLLYARATSTSSAKDGERGAIQLERGRLTKEQWADHEALISVRNQGVAHVNRKHSVDNRSWHKAIFFAVRYPNGAWRPASTSNETSFHLPTLERLERMLPVATDVIHGQFNKRMKAVSAALNEADLSEKAFLEHLFDPVAAFGSADAVRRLLGASKQGIDGFYVND
jgi:hypothetical protein